MAWHIPTWFGGSCSSERAGPLCKPPSCPVATSSSAKPKFPLVRPLHPTHLPHHGLGQHLGSPWATQHVSCLEKDLGPVLDRFQVPLLPGCQGSINGFVNEILCEGKKQP